jgi:hypothetical protein
LNRKFARHRHQAFQPLAELNVIRERFDMPQPPNPQIVKKVKKLSEIADELRQGKDFPVTRLTTIKSLCGEPEATAAFALFLAQRIHSKMREEQSPERYRGLVDRAVKELKPYLTDPRSLLLSIRTMSQPIFLYITSSLFNSSRSR